jgi:hypothetical protein
LTPVIAFAQDNSLPPKFFKFNCTAVKTAKNNRAIKLVDDSMKIDSYRPFSSRVKLSESGRKTFQPDRREIRDFILFNYAHVADNVINGSGIYLDTLYQLLGIRGQEKESWRKECLRSLLTLRSIPDFSNHIAAININ